MHSPPLMRLLIQIMILGLAATSHAATLSPAMFNGGWSVTNKTDGSVLNGAIGILVPTNGHPTLFLWKLDCSTNEFSGPARFLFRKHVRGHVSSFARVRGHQLGSDPTHFIGNIRIVGAGHGTFTLARYPDLRDGTAIIVPQMRIIRENAIDNGGFFIEVWLWPPFCSVAL